MKSEKSIVKHGFLSSFQVLFLQKIVELCEDKNKHLPRILVQTEHFFGGSESHLGLIVSFEDCPVEAWVFYDGADLSSRDKNVDERFERPAYKTEIDMAEDLVKVLSTYL